MKKLLINLSVIGACVFICSLVLNIFIYPQLKLAPWTYGSELIHQKRNQVTSGLVSFNTIFIGSSRTFRHVDPLIVDSVTASNLRTRTYNFGANWLFPPESFFILDQLVNEERLSPQLVVIELSKIPTSDFHNLFTSRSKYWYSFNGYSFAVGSIAGSSFSFVAKLAAFLAHSINYSGNLINLGFVTEALTSRSYGSADMTGMRGFLPLSVLHDNNQEDATATTRHQKFLEDTASVHRRLEVSKEQFQNYEMRPELLETYNRFYAANLLARINEAKAKGVHLVFLIPPRVDRAQLDELIPLFHQLPVSHRLELSDGRKYPELYLATFSYDETHLNEQGAQWYSVLLANKLNELGINRYNF